METNNRGDVQLDHEQQLIRNSAFNLAHRLQEDVELSSDEWEWFQSTLVDQINIHFKQYNSSHNIADWSKFSS